MKQERKPSFLCLCLHLFSFCFSTSLPSFLSFYVLSFFTITVFDSVSLLHWNTITKYFIWHLKPENKLCWWIRNIPVIVITLFLILTTHTRTHTQFPTDVCLWDSSWTSDEEGASGSFPRGCQFCLPSVASASIYDIHILSSPKPPSTCAHK